MAGSFISNVNAIADKLEVIDDANKKFNEGVIPVLEEIAQLDLEVAIDDLKKGTLRGDRKLDIYLPLNVPGITQDKLDKYTTDTTVAAELNALWGEDVATMPMYSKMEIEFDDIEGDVPAITKTLIFENQFVDTVGDLKSELERDVVIDPQAQITLISDVNSIVKGSYVLTIKPEGLDPVEFSYTATGATAPSVLTILDSLFTQINSDPILYPLIDPDLVNNNTGLLLTSKNIGTEQSPEYTAFTASIKDNMTIADNVYDKTLTTIIPIEAAAYSFNLEGISGGLVNVTYESVSGDTEADICAGIVTEVNALHTSGVIAITATTDTSNVLLQHDNPSTSFNITVTPMMSSETTQEQVDGSEVPNVFGEFKRDTLIDTTISVLDNKLRFYDEANRSSNIKEIRLYFKDSTDFVSYDWSDTTSAFQIIASKAGDIVTIGNNLQNLLTLTQNVDELKELQERIPQFIDTYDINGVANGDSDTIYNNMANLDIIAENIPELPSGEAGNLPKVWGNINDIITVADDLVLDEDIDPNTHSAIITISNDLNLIDSKIVEVANNLQGTNTVETVGLELQDPNDKITEVGTDLQTNNYITTLGTDLQLGVASTVKLVADDIASVNTVSTDITNVNTTATNIADVNTIATDIANVNTTAGSIASVNAVAANEININAVNTNEANINTVAVDIANVNAVGASIANVDTTATNIANINTVATDIANVNTVVSNLAEILLADDNATTATAQAVIATTQAGIATAKSDEIKAISVASTVTGAAGTNAAVTYNSADGKFTFIVPQGIKGDKGDSFEVNSVGLLASRGLYDGQQTGFSFLAVDTAEIYFKLSNTSGDWSVAAPFGKGDTGATGAVGNGIADITKTNTTGLVDTYTITYTDTTTDTFTVTNGTDGVEVNDATTALDTTWSSTKISSELSGKEPADATILKSADIGTAVLAPDGDGSGLSNVGIGSFIDTSIAISSDGSALASDTDGTSANNIAIGTNTLTSLTNGTLNIAIGSSALQSATIGANWDTAIGFEAGLSVTDGSFNVLLGRETGKSITTADYNVAIGDNALHGNLTSKLTGSYNIGIGNQTGYNLTTGQYNVLNGYKAGYSLTSASDNVFIGKEAGYYKTSLGNNVAVGARALKGSATNAAIGNTAIGDGAGINISTNNYNVCVGKNAGSNTSHLAGAYDSNYGIAIGYDAYLSTTGEMSLGNSAYITSAYTAVAFATRSDERQKDFYDMDLGLDFVTSITPRKYRWKEDAEASDKDSYFYGFSAQEVKANLPTDDKYGMHRTQGDEDGVQNLTYTEMIAPLYKAIQEQQEMINELKAELNTLKGL